MLRLSFSYYKTKQDCHASIINIFWIKTHYTQVLYCMQLGKYTHTPVILEWQCVELQLLFCFLEEAFLSAQYPSQP